MANSGFRYDIQALRALAVVLVMLFHANPSWMPGGFMGVDVFFTISGFVIFRMILGEIERTEFSLPNFYKRRVVRLFPALFATIAVTLAASSVLLPVAWRADIASSALWSLASLANVYFYLDAGYFSAEALQKPLLHLWSLGVEEQFYLVFPTFTLLIAGLGRGAKATVLLAICLLGAGLSQLALSADPSSAFYLSHNRVFQFAIGALVVLVPPFQLDSKFAGRAWGVMVIAIAAISLFLADEESSLPGWRGLCFAFLVAVLLYLGQSINGLAFVRHRALQSVGNASYSLYLAHWPVAVFMQYQFAEWDVHLLGGLILLLGSLAGVLLYRFIEKPFRYTSRKAALLGPVATSALVIVALSSILLREAPVETVPAKPLLDTQLTIPERTMLIGDSNAAMLVPGLSAALPPGAELIRQTLPGCPPIIDVFKVYMRKGLAGRARICARTQRNWPAMIARRDPQLVIFAARWDTLYSDEAPGYPQGWQDWLVRDLDAAPAYSREQNLELLAVGLENAIAAAGGRPVMIVGPTPLQFPQAIRCALREVEMKRLDDAAINARCGAVSRQLAEKNYASVRQLLSELDQRHAEVHILDPFARFCDAGICIIVEDGQMIYSDINHLSSLGSTELIRYMLENPARPRRRDRLTSAEISPVICCTPGSMHSAWWHICNPLLSTGPSVAPQTAVPPRSRRPPRIPV